MQRALPVLRNAALSLVLLSSSAMADWTLNNEQSALHFVSLKKEHVAEVHTFKTLSGTVGTDGKASLAIDLASVNTNVEIRDQRMREMLFDTAKFTTANITVDLGADGVKPGIQNIKATLDLHGMKKDIDATVAVTENGDNLQVATVAPIIINADDFGLADGINALREAAQLPSISKAVPVTFVLSFAKQPA
ncbi:MAG: YceI family protein [Thiothrix sp.]